jgi:hypothetical protein
VPIGEIFLCGIRAVLAIGSMSGTAMVLSGDGH